MAIESNWKLKSVVQYQQINFQAYQFFNAEEHFNIAKWDRAILIKMTFTGCFNFDEPHPFRQNSHDMPPKRTKKVCHPYIMRGNFRAITKWNQKTSWCQIYLRRLSSG